MHEHDGRLQPQLAGPRCKWQMRGALNHRALRRENRLYADTPGVSRNSAAFGLRPGFLNRRTGEYVLSCFSDGTPAPIHILDGLPGSWVRARDEAGHVVAVAAEIVSGFVRGDRFYTREEAVRATTL